MEALFMAFVIGALIKLVGSGPSPYRPALCMWCPMIVRWKRDRWVHADGEEYKPLGRTSAFHPACPDRTEVYS